MSNARNLANLLNSSGVLTADAGLKADNITIDGTEIDLSSGHLTVDSAGDIILSSGGGEVRFDDGSQQEFVVDMNDASTKTILRTLISDSDLVFEGNDGGTGFTALTLDMSDAGTAIFNHDITLNGKITGASQVTRDVNTSSLALAGGTDSNVGANMIVYGGSHSSLAGVVRFRNGSTETVRIESGILRIGNTSGTVFNSSSATGIIAGTSLQVSNSAGTVGFFNRLSNDGTILGLYKDGNGVGSIANIGSAPVFRNVNEDGISVLTDGGQAILVSTNSSGLADNDGDIGSSSNRFNDAFITNGVTTGSDQNEKQDIASATNKELKVASKLSALFKTYKWKDAVEQKGDKARTHTGIIAQEVQSAFSAEGLDASNYGMFMSDTWWEKEISVDAVEADEEKGIEAKDSYTYMDTKREKTDGYTERTRLGVRYPELFSFIFSSIEARLTALESK